MRWKSALPRRDSLCTGLSHRIREDFYAALPHDLDVRSVTQPKNDNVSRKQTKCYRIGSIPSFLWIRSSARAPGAAVRRVNLLQETGRQTSSCSTATVGTLRPAHIVSQTWRRRGPSYCRLVFVPMCAHGGSRELNSRIIVQIDFHIV